MEWVAGVGDALARPLEGLREDTAHRHATQGADHPPGLPLFRREARTLHTFRVKSGIGATILHNPLSDSQVPAITTSSVELFLCELAVSSYKVTRPRNSRAYRLSHAG